MKSIKLMIAGIAAMGCLLMTQEAGAQSTSSSESTELRAAFEAFEQKDYETALKSFSREAEKGNSEANLMLGMLYYDGLGVAQNKEKARELFQKAEKKGSVKAMIHLAADFILEGDKKKAAALLNKAGKKENIDQVELDYTIVVQTLYSYLGQEYADGKLNWYLKGAEMGHAPSMTGAGHDYQEKKQFKEAIYWLKKAAELDDDFRRKLGLAKVYSDEDAGQYRDEQAALELYRQAADQGSITGTFFLGVDATRKGRYQEGLELLNQAAQGRYPDGKSLSFYIAECHFGLKNYEEAYYRYMDLHGDLYPDKKLKKASAGRLAVMYRDGLGVKKNLIEAGILEAESERE